MPDPRGVCFSLFPRRCSHLLCWSSHTTPYAFSCFREQSKGTQQTAVLSYFFHKATDGQRNHAFFFFVSFCSAVLFCIPTAGVNNALFCLSFRFVPFVFRFVRFVGAPYPPPPRPGRRPPAARALNFGTRHVRRRDGGALAYTFHLSGAGIAAAADADVTATTNYEIVAPLLSLYYYCTSISRQKQKSNLQYNTVSRQATATTTTGTSTVQQQQHPLAYVQAHAN